MQLTQYMQTEASWDLDKNAFVHFPRLKAVKLTKPQGQHDICFLLKRADL